MVADLIHHDPLVYRTIDDAGLPQVGRAAGERGGAHRPRVRSPVPRLVDRCCHRLLALLHQARLHPAPRPLNPPPPPQAFLDSVRGGVSVSMEAVAAVPNTLMALCLNSGAHTWCRGSGVLALEVV